MDKIIYWRLVSFPKKNNFINRFIFKNLITDIIANSKNTKESIIKSFANIDRINKKIKVIYHGIDIDKIDSLSREEITFKDKIKIEKDEIIFCNVGRLSSEKKQKYLIDIGERLKNIGVKFKILIAGEGDLRDDLEKRIKEKKSIKGDNFAWIYKKHSFPFEKDRYISILF